MKNSVWGSVLGCGLAALFCGCPQSGSGYRQLGEKDDVTNTAPADHHHHDHGPHGGHILELGDHHGELAMAADRTLTLYILGADAKTAAPVENATATLHLHAEGGEKEIAFVSAPQEGEADGKTSRFSIAASELPESVKDIEAVHGEVTLKTAAGSATSAISHDHAHHAH